MDQFETEQDNIGKDSSESQTKTKHARDDAKEKDRPLEDIGGDELSHCLIDCHNDPLDFQILTMEPCWFRERNKNVVALNE